MKIIILYFKLIILFLLIILFYISILYKIENALYVGTYKNIRKKYFREYKLLPVLNTECFKIQGILHLTILSKERTNSDAFNIDKYIVSTF